MQPDDSTAVVARAAVVRLTLNQVDTGIRFGDDPNILSLLDKYPLTYLLIGAQWRKPVNPMRQEILEAVRANSEH